MYIRAKDGVYKVVGFDEECIIPSPLIKVKNEYGKERITHCCKDDIITKSENLEELCDEFVYIKDGIASQYLTISFKFKRDDEFCALRNKLTANGIVEISKGISKYELENGELKFAIWTDKGLIYVAKMNDKGDLELI